MFADYSRMARVLMFAAVFLAASEINVLAQRVKAQPDASTNQAPKAARTVHMVYDAVEADMYYSEMRIEQSADNSFFVPCGWENGYFGLQQFDGEEKRALNFAVWNPENMDLPEAMKNAPVEVVYANPSVVVTRLKGKGGGVQCMRQMKWRAGETYRLAVQAQVMGKHTAYTAWLYGAA